MAAHSEGRTVGESRGQVVSLVEVRESAFQIQVVDVLHYCAAGPAEAGHVIDRFPVACRGLLPFNTSGEALGQPYLARVVNGVSVGGLVGELHGTRDWQNAGKRTDSAPRLCQAACPWCRYIPFPSAAPTRSDLLNGSIPGLRISQPIIRIDGLIVGDVRGRISKETVLQCQGIRKLSREGLRVHVRRLRIHLTRRSGYMPSRYRRCCSRNASPGHAFARTVSEAQTGRESFLVGPDQTRWSRAGITDHHRPE